MSLMMERSLCLIAISNSLIEKLDVRASKNRKVGKFCLKPLPLAFGPNWIQNKISTH